MGITNKSSTAMRGIRAFFALAALAAVMVTLLLPPVVVADTTLTDSAILDKLQLWVAADDAAHLVTVDGKLRWFDKRETSTATPTRIYAESAGANNPIVATVATNNQSRTAMDFGDRNSGRYMAWKKPNGTTVPIDDYNIRHVFAVYSMHGTFFGNIFGSVDSTPSAFVYAQASGDTTELPFFINDDSRSIIWNGRAWFDGRRFDGYHERPSFALYRHGFHLLEVEPTPWKGGFANALFYRNTSNPAGNGGGYLCEALTFTNALTEAERALVEDYLMNRWSLGTRDKLVHVADGETQTIDASSGDVAEDRLRFAGSGTIRKTGSGTFAYASQTLHDFQGALEIAAGSVNLVTPLPFAASAGDRLTATAGAGRIVTRTADAGAGTIVKDGAGELTLAEVPADVTQLDVRAGTLTVRRKPANVGCDLGSPILVAIPNASFEEIADDANLINGVKKLGSAGFHGWRGNDNPRMFHWPTWKDTKSSEAQNQKGSAFLSSVAPSDGDCALYFLSAGWAETDVTIPSAGVYELSLDVYGRNLESVLCNSCAVSLLDADGNTVAEFGKARYMDFGQTGEKALSAEVLTAGSYRLRFDSQIGIAIDNLRLSKVAEIDPGAFPIPHGDFEETTLLSGANAKVITNENACVGWTLALDSGTLNATQPEVALTTRLMHQKQSRQYVAYNGGGAYYNDSRAPRGGYVELLFRNAGAYATTETFTAHAGTNYLRCAAAYINGSPATIEATVTVGGQMFSLGTLAPDNKLMRDRFFPVPLALDAPAAVTLTLRCTEGGSNDFSTGTVIDDLALVPFADEAIGDNLVTNGDFEATAAPYGWSVANGWVNRTYSEAYGALGTDPSGGSQFLSLHGAGTFAVQDVAFPAAGRYRLRFRYRNRNSSGFDPKPVTAWLAKDGVTNVLCRVGGFGNDAKYTAHVDEIADFDIPAAGTYRLGLSAVSAGHAFIDDVEVRRISDRFDDSAPVCASDLEISVAQGAHVVLDFRGVQKVESLRLGGHYVSGLIGANTFPEYLSGSGVLDVPARATVILMK